MNDEVLLEQFLAGDRQAFCELVVRYQPSILGIARHYVNSASTAEDVAQDTWIAVMRGADRFEGRSSFKTWLFRILVNRARTTGTKESRTIPVDPTDSGATVSAARFDGGGAWRVPPEPFTEAIDNAVANEKVIRLVHESIASLPEPQRAVVTLRDAEGLSTMEVAELLGLSEANVRVILHRGRARVRNDVETRMQGGES